MRSVSSPQPELELVVIKTIKPIVGCGGAGDGANSEFVKKKEVISDTCVKYFLGLGKIFKN